MESIEKKKYSPLELLYQDIEIEKSSHINYLTGRILTIIEAIIPNGEQQKAIKDIVKEAMYSNYFSVTPLRFVQYADANGLEFSEDILNTQNKLQLTDEPNPYKQ